MHIADSDKLLRRARRVAGALLAGSAIAGMAALAPAQAAQPIKIGVLAPASAINGKAIFQGAELAADQINANGGINGRQIKLITYDNHASASDAVRAFQRAARQDHVVAVTGSFISEVALAVEPWAARLKTPFVVTGAASTEITKKIHDHYNQYKYVFHDWLNSFQIGESVCDFSKDILVGQLHYQSAAIMSENAAWTKPLDAAYEQCLPKAGLKVVAKQVFSPDTNDFSPIFSKIKAANPDVIVTGIAHVGVKPTVQWHSQQVPLLMTGVSAQAGASTFWDATNGATEGVVTESAGAPGGKVTAKSVPFQDAYRKKFGGEPAYDAYSTYDSIYFLKNAIERAGSTNGAKLVSALEKTDYTGTWGTVKFHGKDSKFTHGLVYGSGGVRGVMLQWQKGKQVTIWPQGAATGQITIPDFVKQAQ